MPDRLRTISAAMAAIPVTPTNTYSISTSTFNLQDAALDRSVHLIFGGLAHGVDNNHFHRPLGAFELEAELFLKRCEDRKIVLFRGRYRQGRTAKWCRIVR